MTGTTAAETSGGLTEAIILGAMAIAILFGLASYHFPHRKFFAQGAGLLVSVTAVVLFGGSAGNVSQSVGAKASLEAEAFGSLGLGLLVILTMILVLSARSRTWGRVVWWIGVGSTIATVPFVAIGEPGLALGSLVGGPGLLMFVAFRHPEIPASLTRFGLGSWAGPLTQTEIDAEQSRYTRIALTLTLVTLVLLWRGGGVPERPAHAEAAVDQSFDPALAAQGQKLSSEYGCKGCHSIDGSAGSGPTWKGRYGAKVRLSTGKQMSRDEAYIRESIVNPDAKVVANYSSGSMAAGLGTKLTNELTVDANVKALVEYYKSVRAAAS